MNSEFPLNLDSSFLEGLSDSGIIWVAYSGGLDSLVLLHAVHQFLLSTNQTHLLKAVHINHGLQQESDMWAEHCQLTCQNLDIACHVEKANIDSSSSSNLEEKAREARYEIFKGVLKAGDVLLMAHHLDDQVETMLYRLARGSGAQGLAGMPKSRELGLVHLYRPLLQTTRKQLQEYADEQGLAGLEDPSNQNEQFDRNFLRHKVLPQLINRWPAFLENANKSSEFLVEATQAQEALADIDMQKAASQWPNRLNVKEVLVLPEWRQKNLLRFWILKLSKEFHFSPVDQISLKRLVREVLPAGEDTNPLVYWPKGSRQVEVRKFANHLCLLLPLVLSPEEQSRSDIIWNEPSKPLRLPGELGTLTLERVKSNGFALDQHQPLVIRFRQEGMSFKPAGRSSKSFKKLCQDYLVPPWMREYLPLVYQDEDFLSFADLFIDDSAFFQKGKNLYRICWQKSDLHCGM